MRHHGRTADRRRWRGGRRTAAHFIYALAPDGADLIEDTVERILDNGNRLTFNCYAAYGEREWRTVADESGDGCPSVSRSHPANKERFGNGQPALPGFEALCADQGDDPALLRVGRLRRMPRQPADLLHDLPRTAGDLPRRRTPIILRR